MRCSLTVSTVGCKSQTDWHIAQRRITITFTTKRESALNVNILFTHAAHENGDNHEHNEANFAFGFRFTYCDVHGIKQICLLHLRDPIAETAEQFTKAKRPSTFSFSVPSANNCMISLAKISIGNLESCSYDVLPTWVKYCPIIAYTHLPYVIQDRTLNFFCQLKQESARQCRQRPAAHRSQQFRRDARKRCRQTVKDG